MNSMYCIQHDKYLTLKFGASKKNVIVIFFSKLSKDIIITIVLGDNHRTSIRINCMHKG